mgnify:CR=1 FL=1|tara:strand:- start:167 stop:880 length:714 start_codon:yes stop_codon:yes gene_type:complete
MATTNVIATRATGVNYQGSTSLAHSAAQTNATHTAGSSTQMAATYFFYSAANLYINYRAFMNFSLSSLSGTVTGVTLTMTRANSQALPNFHFLASEAGNEVATSDYQDGLVGASSYPFNSDVTEFTDSAIDFDEGGAADDTVTVTLNSAAVSHANAVIGTSDRFKVAMVNEYDFNNTYASSGISNSFVTQGAVFYSHLKSGDSQDPFITITTADAVSPSFKIKGGSVILKGGNLTIK